MGGTAEQLLSAQGRDGGDAQKSGTCCWCKRFLSAAEPMVLWLPIYRGVIFPGWLLQGKVRPELGSSLEIACYSRDVAL